MVYVLCEQTMWNASLTLRVNGELVPDGIMNPRIVDKKMWGQEMSVRPKCVRKFIFEKPGRAVFFATQDFSENGWLAECPLNIKPDHTYYIEFKHKGLLGGDYQFVTMDDKKGKKAVSEIPPEDVLHDFVVKAEQRPAKAKEKAPASEKTTKKSDDKKSKSTKKGGKKTGKSGKGTRKRR